MNENSKRKINPISFVGGVLLVISALFLPWINLPILGGAKLLDLQKMVNELSSMAKAFGSNAPESASVVSSLILIIFFLLLIGGIISIFKPKLGGGIGLLGIVIFTIPMVKYFSYVDSGYYIAWIGAIIALLSNKIMLKGD